jgi:hypothetical protein
MKFLYKQLLFVLLVCIGFSANAQVSVTATAGTTGPTVYTTLKAAFDAINAGTHTGSITVAITANTTETASAVLNASGTGSASYTAVLIRPTAGASISGTVDGPMIDLNGAKNVTIDGRIGSTGTTRSLTIANLSTSGNPGTSTVRMINSTQNNIITYSNILGSSVLGTTGIAATILIDSSLTGAGNNNITISNNDIGVAGTNLPTIALYSVGESATLLNSNVTVINNLFHDYFNPAGLSSAIVADIFSSGWTISGNSFYQSAVRTSTAAVSHIVMYLNDGTGYTITGNSIGGSQAGAAGTAYTLGGTVSNFFAGIYMRVGTTTVSNVDGNTIENISVTTTPTASSFAFNGIRTLSGNVNIGVNNGNNIGAQSGSGSINIITNGTFGSFTEAIITGTSAGAGGVDIRNNNIGSFTLSGNTTGAINFRAMEISAPTTLNVQANLIGGSTSASLQLNTASGSMLGIFYLPTLTGVTYTITGNTIRNFTNNGTGTGTASITGIQAQANASNINIINTITNNQIYNFSSPATTATAGTLTGIVNTQSASLTSVGVDANINSNTIYNFTSGSSATGTGVRGITNSNGFPNFLNINNNQIYQLTAAAPNTAGTATAVVQGIQSGTSGAGVLTINGNTIYNLESTAAAATTTSVYGIGAFYGTPGTNGAIISKNRIYDLRNPNTSGIVSGIVARGAAGTPNVGSFLIHNNMISLSAATAAVYGINVNQVAAAVVAYYNSVYISGTGAGTNPSAAFARLGAAIGTPIEIKNNIFYNIRTGGSAGNFAVYNNNTTPATAWVSDFNNLYSATAGSVAFWGSALQDLATYKTAAADINSKSVTVSFVNTATADLHLSGASVTDANLNGTPVVGVTIDFDNDTRSSTTPKMGADEPVVVCVAPAITTQPAAVTSCAGTAVNFSVTATGTNLTYQWRKGTTNISGATSSTYSIAAAVAGDAGDYNVVISNGCGTVTSGNATLTVTAAPTISAQPVATTVCAGSAANFSVTATGTGTLTYQWRKDGTDIAGANSATYSIPATTAANAGNYTVRVSAGTCSVTSNAAALTITPVTAITTQPAAVTTCLQQNATFTVVATGGAGLTYQWRKDGTNIAGATSASYTVTNITAASAGNYSVVVTGPGTGLCGTVTSNNAALTVSGPCTSIPNVDADITNVVLMPSLVNHNTTLRVNAGRAMSISWNIVDMSGKVVMTFTRQVLAGQNDIQLRLSQLGAGTYQLMGISPKGRTEVLRLIKL